jgi:hypothetical protein
MPTTTKRTALQAYMEAHATALALAERITAAIANHDTVPAPEDIHWGNVGDMAEIRRQLQAISDRLFAEGEYAPQAK